MLDRGIARRENGKKRGEKKNHPCRLAVLRGEGKKERRQPQSAVCQEGGKDESGQYRIISHRLPTRGGEEEGGKGKAAVIEFRGGEKGGEGFSPHGKHACGGKKKKKEKEPLPQAFP